MLKSREDIERATRDELVKYLESNSDSHLLDPDCGNGRSLSDSVTMDELRYAVGAWWQEDDKDWRLSEWEDGRCW